MVAPQVEDTAAILAMTLVLAEVGYRDLARDAARQRISVCRRLWREGLDERLLRMLWAYAQSCGDNPTRLFCWWMDRPSRTIEKVNEMRQRSGWTERVLSQAVEKEREKASEKPAPIHDMKQWRKSQ